MLSSAGPHNNMLSTASERTRITSWTEFELPIEDGIPRIYSLASSNADEPFTARWAEVLQPLRDAPGFLGGEWGRIIECPARVLLLTGE